MTRGCRERRRAWCARRITCRPASNFREGLSWVGEGSGHSRGRAASGRLKAGEHATAVGASSLYAISPVTEVQILGREFAGRSGGPLMAGAGGGRVPPGSTAPGGVVRAGLAAHRDVG